MITKNLSIALKGTKIFSAGTDDLLCIAIHIKETSDIFDCKIEFNKNSDDNQDDIKPNENNDFHPTIKQSRTGTI